MGWKEFAVEILRVVLGAPLLTAVVALVAIFLFRNDIGALLRRVATVRFPGGELTTSQADRSTAAETPAGNPAPVSTEPAEIPGGVTLSPADQQKLSEFVQAERARATLWEFRYLNHYLVVNTQRVLDWLSALPQRTTAQMYDSFWQPIVPAPRERAAILEALQSHHLVQLDGALIEVTAKGREYLAWRGPLQLPPSVPQ